MISEINEKMLGILAETLHGRPAAAVSHEKWALIYKELTAQTVHALPSVQVMSLGLGTEDYVAYLAAFSKNVTRFHKILNAQQEILSKLEEAGIGAAILKGTTSALNYPKPELRSPGDIDLIVPPEDYEKAYEVIRATGYEPTLPADEITRHIPFYSADNVEVELHSFFSNLEQTGSNRVLNERVRNGVRNRTFGELLGQRIPMLPTVERGLVMLSHVNQHLRYGVGLRHIIDWMFFVEKNVSDKYWNREFAEAAESIGLRRLAVVLTAMCQKYLGMDPAVTWAKLEEGDTIADELMEYVLASGNFGKKDSVANNNVSRARLMLHPIRLFKRAQDVGSKDWPLCQKHRWLRPFAWLYQIFVWIGRIFTGRIKPAKVLDAVPKEKARAELLARAGAQ